MQRESVERGGYRYGGSTGASMGVFTTGTAPRDPENLVFGPDGNLYVASDRDHKVLRYDGTTGAYMDDFVAAGSGGLDNAQGAGFGPDGNFYVSSWKNDNVVRYNGTTGAFIDVYASVGLGGLDTRPTSMPKKPLPEVAAFRRRTV